MWPEIGVQLSFSTKCLLDHKSPPWSTFCHFELLVKQKSVILISALWAASFYWVQRVLNSKSPLALVFFLMVVPRSFWFYFSFSSPSVSISHLDSIPSTTLLSLLFVFSLFSFSLPFWVTLSPLKFLPHLPLLRFCLSLSFASSVSSNVLRLPHRRRLPFFLSSFSSPSPPSPALSPALNLFSPRSHHVCPLFRLIPPVSCLLKHQRSQRAVEPPADSTHNSPLLVMRTTGARGAEFKHWTKQLKEVYESVLVVRWSGMVAFDAAVSCQCFPQM